MTLSLLAAARENPEAPALVETGRMWTFGELAEPVAVEAAAVAHALGWNASRRECGEAAPGVLLDAAPTFDALVRLWALAEIGVTAVLVHQRWTADERARAAAVVPDAVNLAELEAVSALAPWDAPPPADDGRPFAVAFTSGSSGVPKAVPLPRAALAASAAASAARLSWHPDDRWLLSLPFAHVGGLSIVTRCLLARRPVVLGAGRDAAATLALVAAERVTLLSVVAAQLRRFLDASPERAPASLRAVLVGGGPCPLPLLDEAWLRGWPVLPTYGLTETCSQVATAAPGWRPVDGLAVPPLPGVEVRVDGGEILLRGPMVCPDPEAPRPAGGWLRTGDLGRLDERGRLEVVGRRDAVIVTGGENVSPEEVEAALAACPGVREALVFGVGDPAWGALVAAAVVPAHDAELDRVALRRELEVRLAPFKRPRRLAVVASLPLLPNGKPDRAGAARELAAELRPF